MKKHYLYLCLLIAPLLTAAQGYEIKITLKPFKNQYIYLGHHFGTSKPIIDSIKLNDKSEGVFRGSEKLKGGIYLVGYPGKKEYFEILVDKHQKFSIIADTANITRNIVFKNSAENVLFNNYQVYIEAKGKENGVIQQGLVNSRNEQEIASLKKKRQDLNDSLQQYRDDYERRHPNTMLAVVFRSLKEPIVPPGNQHPGGRYDSSYAWQYYKQHYWDWISFTDERLLRTPIFEDKLKTYFTSIVYPTPDSLQKEAGRIIDLAKPNREMFKFILSTLVDKYINPEYMGHDAVFVYLFEKYISTGQADWLTEKQRKFVFDRAYSMMANLVGAIAPDLQMLDTEDKPASLYSIDAPYMVLVFWDPECGHCKEVIPKVDSMFQAKWKNQGVKLYAVMSDGGKPAWLKYIKENSLQGWIHVYQSEEQKQAAIKEGRPGFKQLYDLQITPRLFLLDSQKRIIAKSLTYDQLNDLLQKKIGNN